METASANQPLSGKKIWMACGGTGCVRTASGSDRIRKSPRIKTEPSRKRISANRAEMNFATLPDPVATARGSDTPARHGLLIFRRPAAQS